MASVDGYPNPDVPLEVADLLDEQNDLLAARMPGFQPADASPGTWLREAIATTGAAVSEQLAQWSAFTYAYLGVLDGRPPLQATPAQATSTWMFVNTGVQTIRQGTPVKLTLSDGTGVDLVVAADISKAAGSTTQAGVPLVTVLEGAALNDLSGTLQLDEGSSDLDSIALVGLTYGALDGETEDSFLNALTELRQLGSDKPVLAQEWTTYALRRPGVGGVVVIDLFNPVTNDTNARATSTVIAFNPQGLPLLEADRAALESYLRGLVLQHEDVFVRDAGYTDVDVQATYTTLPNYSAAAVGANLTAAITDFLNPYRWGLVQSGDRATWVAKPKLAYLDLATHLSPQTVPGMAQLTSLGLRVHGASSYGTADITMTGLAPRPRLQTASVTPA